MALWGPGARAADVTIKIGYIDPFSGAFAAGGDASLKMFQFIIDNINAKGGALGKKFELVTFDDKLQPAEALIALKSVTDQNLPFVMSCVGSNVGSALIDAVNKHNTRNPDNRVLQLNCGQLATELTNEQCNLPDLPRKLCDAAFARPVGVLGRLRSLGPPQVRCSAVRSWRAQQQRVDRSEPARRGRIWGFDRNSPIVSAGASK